MLFVDGEALPCDDPELARLLCSRAPLDARALKSALARKPDRALIEDLVARGALYCED
jgi:hypothetical protein